MRISKRKHFIEVHTVLWPFAGLVEHLCDNGTAKNIEPLRPSSAHRQRGASLSCAFL